MAITTEMVKELRGITSAGVSDCKNALVEADGDMEKAIEILREKGLSKSAKKASRIAAEGAVYAYADAAQKRGVIVEVNCETDFVANTDKFKALCKQVAEQILTVQPDYVRCEEAPEGYTGGKCLLRTALHTDPSKTVEDLISDATVSIGEKIDIRRFVLYSYEKGKIDTYIHMGGKIGVMVQFSCESDCADGCACKAGEFGTFAHDVAMHIAASNPTYVRSSEVPQAEIDHEREILKAQAANENKPANIIEKMVDGRIKKFFGEICLLDQPFVKDPEVTVGALMNELSKKLNDKIDVVRFVRYECGEGIEKRVNDLAAEVAAATQGN